MYLVGKVISTHGIKGEIKIKSDTSFNRFDKGSILFIGDEKSAKKITVSSHRVHQGFDLITFNDINDINLVLDYVGKNVYVKEHNREKDHAKIYYEDLIDDKVIGEDGTEYGVVSDIIEVPQGILLQIKNKDKLSLVPYVDEFVLKVDIKNKTVLLHVIEGLL